MEINATWVFILVLTTVELLGIAALLVSGLSPRLETYSNLFKIAVIMSVAGLLGSVFRNIAFLLTGVLISDFIFPFIVSKTLREFGIISIAFCYVFQLTHKKPPIQAAEKPQPKRKPKEPRKNHVNQH